MEVEFTARQGKISKALRSQAEEGMERIAKLLGRTAHASITFSTQRHLQIVELTVGSRSQQIAATGKGATQDAALRQAMEHGENQARKYRDRRMGSKRLPKEEKVMTAPPVARPKSRAAEPTEEAAAARQTKAKARTSIAVHSFPVRATVVEPHILKSAEAIALKPLTIEEAVKETEFRDRDLLIFHTPAGQMYVLHRRRDGQMELVEMP
jgi:putative sigma-54 modulation protein